MSDQTSDQASQLETESPKPRRRRRTRAEMEAAGIDRPPSDIGLLGRAASGKIERECALISASLMKLVTSAATAAAFVNQVDSQIIAYRGTEVVSSLVDIARNDADFRAALLKGSKNSSMFGLVLSLALLALPIAANHGLIKGMPGIMLVSIGTTPPVDGGIVASIMQQVTDTDESAIPNVP